MTRLHCDPFTVSKALLEDILESFSIGWNVNENGRNSVSVIDIHFMAGFTVKSTVITAEMLSEGALPSLAGSD